MVCASVISDVFIAAKIGNGHAHRFRANFALSPFEVEPGIASIISVMLRSARAVNVCAIVILLCALAVVIRGEPVFGVPDLGGSLPQFP
jgi:hypothetical protein